MPQLYDWLQRIKDVEREWHAIRIAADRLLVDAASDSTMLPRELRLRDVRTAAERLEGTYFIRLFAEFEAGLRHYLRKVGNKRPPTRTRNLLQRLAATCRIPHDVLANAHSVREYRNTLVHARSEQAQLVAMPEARSHLCVFFSFLPPNW